MATLTKKQISDLKRLHSRANKAHLKLSNAVEGLAGLIESITQVDGHVDFLQGDGFGFTPLSNNDTHIPIVDLIKFAENGKDITEDFILGNLSI